MFNVGTDTPLAGVTINLSGAATMSTTTDALGNYAFFGLLAEPILSPNPHSPRAP